MIVRLKKVTVICTESDREQALASLRDTGTVHVVPLTTPAGDALTTAVSRLTGAGDALSIIGRLPAGTALHPGTTGGSAADHVRRIVELDAFRQNSSEKCASLQQEVAALEPLGSFDPDQVKALRDAGVVVKLYKVVQGSMPDVPDGVVVRRLGSSGREEFMALAGRGEFQYPATEIPLPRRPLKAAIEELASLRGRLAGAEEELRSLAACAPAIEAYVAEQSDEVALCRARAGMAQQGPLALLQGFVPADTVASFRELAAREGWALLVTDPSDTEQVPTLLRMPAWVRPIESLFQLIKILPGYREADVSASFLIFLSIFFAMIIGDAGYGLIFLGLTWFLRRKMRSAPAGPFRLMTIFSICTIVWGLLSGTFFAMVEAPAPLRCFKIDWLADSQNVMHLCIFLGAIHLSVAHIWNMLRTINSTLAIAQAGWTAVTWTMFFAARAMLLGKPFPGWFVPIAILGLVAVLLFMTPVKRLKTEWVNHAMLPLTLMSNFGDILSYLRLFALGVAGLQLAGAFNSMALSLGFSNPLKGLIAALIIFIGHGMNVALGAVSVLVHGVRLNALEFSMHFGLEWAGIPYQPLTKHPAKGLQKAA